MTDRLPRPRWRDRPGWRVAAASAPALLLILVSLWEMVAVTRASAREPGEDWSSLSAALRAAHRPGDLILFAPAWIDPLGRQHLGDLIPVAMAARMDAARYATLWEVAERGAQAPESAGLRPTSSQNFGLLTLRRYEQRPIAVVTDLVEALPGARVSGPTRARPVVRVEEVGFAPRRCVVTVPAAGKTVRIAYTGVRLGRELVGYVGLADVFTRRDVREPARLVASIDGRQVADVTIGVEDGWVRFAAPTSGEPAAEVEFAITAVGPRAHGRRVCFAAEARS